MYEPERTAKRIVKAMVVLVFLTFCACTQTATATGPNGGHCETTASSFLFWASGSMNCWDSNGNLTSHSEVHLESSPAQDSFWAAAFRLRRFAMRRFIAR